MSCESWILSPIDYHPRVLYEQPIYLLVGEGPEGSRVLNRELSELYVPEGAVPVGTTGTVLD